MKKKVKEWIAMLPPPYRGEAFMIRVNCYWDVDAVSLEQAIRLGCRNCIQRTVILNALERGEFDPKGEARMEVAMPDMPDGSMWDYSDLPTWYHYTDSDQFESQYQE